jgi:hypothetical protein
MRHINPGSSIARKCELYLERLLSIVQAIHGKDQLSSKANAYDLTATAQAQDTISSSGETPGTLQLGSGALAPAMPAGSAAGRSGAMLWENFLLDPGQFDDLTFGM